MGEGGGDGAATGGAGDRDQAEVVDFLLGRPGAGSAPRRVDTHGAVVILAGADVYKMKRAVRLPFMDLSTLEKRRIACGREIEVNLGFAPGLYRGVVPVTRNPGGGLGLGGEGAVVEWLVHMRRFDETLTFDHLADRAALTPDLLARTAAVIAAAHRRAPVNASSDFAGHLSGIVDENVETLLGLGSLDRDRVARLGEATRGALGQATPLLHQRQHQDYVRRCHADLHLRNIVLIDGEPTLFDALEFDEAFATIDVLYDLAFLIVDLWDRQGRFEANHVLNRYLVEARDEAGLAGLAALPLFLAVRATIRAKVEALRFSQTGEAAFGAAAERYLGLAEEALRPVPPHLVAIGGLSGSGKSSVAARIAPSLGRLPGAVHLRSDVERKALLRVAERERLPDAAYDEATTEAVYAVLHRKAQASLRTGVATIVDAVHQQESERQAIGALAERLGVRFTGVWLEAPRCTLEARVDRRRGDASDADARVVAQQADRDCGPIAWHPVDASRPLEVVVAEVLALVGAAEG
jgi:aminoglycoside phosphotransferase family enzyme/predicted kinase